MNRDAAASFILFLDLDGDLASGHAPKPVQKWLETLGLPLDLLRFMQWNWPQKDALISAISIRSSKSLMESEESAHLIAHKLLPIGWGPNGDNFAIDFSNESCPVGFINHEECGEDDDPRPHFEPAARSIESFLFQVADGRFFPSNYDETTAMNEFLASEAAHESFPPYRRIAGRDDNR